MPHSEYLGWQAYYAMEPRGETRDDWRSALQSAVLANVHRDRKKQKKAFAPKDFLLSFEKKTDVEGEQSPEATRALVEMLAAAYGGRIEIGEVAGDNALLSDED